MQKFWIHKIVLLLLFIYSYRFVMFLHILLHGFLFNFPLTLGDIVSFQVHHVIVANLQYKQQTIIIWSAQISYLILKTVSHDFPVFKVTAKVCQLYSPSTLSRVALLSPWSICRSPGSSLVLCVLIRSTPLLSPVYLPTILRDISHLKTGAFKVSWVKSLSKPFNGWSVNRELYKIWTFMLLTKHEIM